MLALFVISFLLLAVVAYLVARPFVVTAGGSADETVGAEGTAPVEQAKEDQDIALSQINDLRMEYATGKLGEEDYRAMLTHRRAELEVATRALDTLFSRDKRSEAEDDLERLIAIRKRELAREVCPACGARHGSDDHYCSTCGQDLTKVGST